MKKSRIIVLALFSIVVLTGCTNSQNKQIQQPNDLLNQQNILLQQSVNQQDTNTTTSEYIKDITNHQNDTPTIPGNTKTIPFDAIIPARSSKNY